MSGKYLGTTVAIAALIVTLGAAFTAGQGYGVRVPEPALLPGQKPFDLTLEETRKFSRSKGVDVVGHSYFKGDWVTPSARQRARAADQDRDDQHRRASESSSAIRAVGARYSAPNR